VTIRPRGGKSPITVVAVFSCPKCARVCARMAAFLPYPAPELLNHEFVQITWETAVELMCNEKQRNRENFNFKSVESAVFARSVDDSSVSGEFGVLMTACWSGPALLAQTLAQLADSRHAFEPDRTYPRQTYTRRSVRKKMRSFDKNG